MAKIDGLTPGLYLKYKRKGLTDLEVGRLFDRSHTTVNEWKKENGLGDVDIKSWDTWDKYFPEEINRMKKTFSELHDRFWEHSAIAKEMEMSIATLTKFKKRYFPELMQEKKSLFTKEQIETAKKNGIALNTAWRRVKKQGMAPDQAVREPIAKGWRGDPNARMIGDVPISEVEDFVSYQYPFTPQEVKRASKKGITWAMLTNRYRKGWKKTRALTQPPGKRRGKTKNVRKEN